MLHIGRGDFLSDELYRLPFDLASGEASAHRYGKDFVAHLFLGTDPEMMSAYHSPTSSGAHRCQTFVIVSISVISAESVNTA